jgi:effector-binding domain-containing protein
MRRLLLVVFALLVGATLVFGQTADAKAPEAKAAPKTEIIGEIAVKDFPPMTAAMVVEKASSYVPAEGFKPGMEGASQAYGIMSAKAFEKLGAWIHGGGKPLGPAFGVYAEDPEKVAAKDLTVKMGFPVADDTKGAGDIVIEKFPIAHMVVLQYKGPYEGSMEPWVAIGKWMGEHGYDWDGPAMEVYLKGPGDTQNPADYLTEIRCPVKKVTAPKPAEAAPKTK